MLQICNLSIDVIQSLVIEYRNLKWEESQGGCSLNHAQGYKNNLHAGFAGMEKK